jgi:hypothetical protein
MVSLLERYKDRIEGVLSCYDRVLITATLPGFCYAGGMTSYLKGKKIRIFDYPQFAQPFADTIRKNAERLAEENGLEIEFIRKIRSFRKEDRIQEIITKRGVHPGLVHVFSAMEICESYQPWHDKKTGNTFLKPKSGKCLHYYFYFIDPDLGLCHLRVPTWCPFRLQFYFNAHNLLAAELRKRKIEFSMVDNAFLRIADWKTAQEISDGFSVRPIHRRLDSFADLYCPITHDLGVAYHWSLSQVEYATDIIFRSRDDLYPIYDMLVRTAVHAIKAEHVATFLGRKLSPLYQGELGNDFDTRIQGTRIRHSMGSAAIKMYDKFGTILRIETVANDVGFFKHHREVEQKDGQKVVKLAPVRKTIYSLQPDLRELMAASNQRYIGFLSALDDPHSRTDAIDKLSRPVEEEGRHYRGFNVLTDEDQVLFQVLSRGEFNISGLRNKDLQKHLQDKKPFQISHILRRLRTHGLLKKVGRTYKYYITSFGRLVTTAALKVRELVLIPALAQLGPVAET